MTKITKDKKVLDFGPIDKAVNDLAEMGMYKGVSGTSKARTIKKSTASVMDEIKKEIAEWKGLEPAEFHSPEGMDKLKQAIGDIADRYNSIENRQPRYAADHVYQAIRDHIAQQAPDYGRMMSDYETASASIREIERALSIPGGGRAARGTIDTAARKLTSIMRNNVNTNFGARLRNVEALEKSAPEARLMPAIAGHSLNAPMPRGLAGTGTQLAATGLAGQLLSPWVLGTLPFQSPRLMGEAAHLGRRVGPTIPRAAGRMGFQTGRMGGLLNDQRNR